MNADTRETAEHAAVTLVGAQRTAPVALTSHHNKSCRQDTLQELLGQGANARLAPCLDWRPGQSLAAAMV